MLAAAVAAANISGRAGATITRLSVHAPLWQRGGLMAVCMAEDGEAARQRLRRKTMKERMIVCVGISTISTAHRPPPRPARAAQPTYMLHVTCACACMLCMYAIDLWYTLYTSASIAYPKYHSHSAARRKYASVIRASVCRQGDAGTALSVCPSQKCVQSIFELTFCGRHTPT